MVRPLGRIVKGTRHDGWVGMRDNSLPLNVDSILESVVG